MSDDSPVPRRKPRSWKEPSGQELVLVLLCITAMMAAVWFRKEWRDSVRDMKAAHADLLERTNKERDEANEEIEVLKKNASQRETVLAAREGELRQREAAIAGRENAATERTESSFQGLLIQQQLTKNLEALKASLPDMTPEVDRLAKEHAQSEAERQRLQKENADLLRRLNPAASLESR